MCWRGEYWKLTLHRQQRPDKNMTIKLAETEVQGRVSMPPLSVLQGKSTQKVRQPQGRLQPLHKERVNLKEGLGMYSHHRKDREYEDPKNICEEC